MNPPNASHSSQFIDHFLNPPTTELPSFVKDTTHFFQLLENMGPLPPNCLLEILDVISLYTNIDHPTGLEAIREGLKQSL